MANFNTNILLAIVAGIILILVIYYLSKNNDQPIPNNGTISNVQHFTTTTQQKIPAVRQSINNRMSDHMNDDISDSIVDELVSRHDVERTPMGNNDDNEMYSPSDPMANQYGPFDGYVKKRQINMRKMESPYCDDDDSGVFSHKKKKFVKRTPNDIEDLFDIQKMLPQETEDWFDTVPLQSTKKIQGTHLLHPKTHMGVNTVGSSLKNATHDMRGDVPCPKISISPWGNSTIEPDTNMRGFCGPA